jgi:hypothetical protein
MTLPFNWAKISADITAALTAIAIIPYDKDTLDLINRVVPADWVPWIIKIGIASTLALRLIGRKR